ncbi:alpha/beta fold hydrolase [Nocardioides bizhenqiangii]|uniref:Alpha/beta fold hydrolase n=1 Tax=Nocardioides bizhenqiangii TaxID=3095076 RepID=A0ABZ0ZPD0_9ACTN|nr:alpha/beta fold hydrolase [Nocardioides sp. HM61]WQQ26073.1 alpha/beta fold hydrolase [Nocardioides sp. HM61]
MNRGSRCLVLLAALAAAATLTSGATTASAEPDPTPAPASYDVAADLANMRAAYGRIIGPGGQLQNPAYLPALVRESTLVGVSQLMQQLATPDRLALTPAMVVPGWNVGNPLRATWEGSRGRSQQVAFTNRFGALLRGTVYAPLPGATDPYTGAALRAPYPGVVITPGSVGGSQGMYEWLAQDLAERGYLVLLYDVQGQGTSETLPHDGDPVFPFCNPFGAIEGDPALGTEQMTPCPGVPFQQLSNFTTGTVDALDFFVSRPSAPYANPAAGTTEVDRFNPWWREWDRSPIRNPRTPGRTTRLAIVGHSMGGAAVSYVQGYDERVAAVVALDKLWSEGPAPFGQRPVRPVVPSLGIQAEYGFTPSPWHLSAGSSLVPALSPQGPDPRREKATGFDRWSARGLETMVVVPRASTHLEFADVPLVLPASRYGQALSSVYTQAWLGHYLKGDTGAGALLAPRFRYLEPVGRGRWAPVRLVRDELLSERYCSAYRLRVNGAIRADGDINGVGC